MSDTPSPYSPSWINRFTTWSGARPLPSWLFYVLLFTLWIAFELAAGFTAGLLPAPRVDFTLLYNRFAGAFMSTVVLAFQSYLFAEIGEVVDRSRSLSALSDEEVSKTKYEFVVIPARPYLVFSVVAFAFGVRLGMFNEGIDQITAPTLLLLVDWGLLTAVFLGFLYQVLRLTRHIAAFYGTPLRLDLYHVAPVYELSGLAAKVAVFVALVWYLNVPFNAQFIASPLLIAAVVIISLIPLAIFILPLRGLNRRLELEKKTLLADASLRLESAFTLLDRKVDAGDLKDMQATQAALASLILKRSFIEAIPTWPWRPSSFRAVLTAVLLPVFIYLVQQILDRVLLG